MREEGVQVIAHNGVEDGLRRTYSSTSGRGSLQGRVERQGEVIHVLALGLERLALPKGEAVPTRSRDFH